MNRHLAGLIKRHRAIDAQISRQSRARAPSSLTLRRLKQMRLVLKDQIALLSRGRQPQIG